MLSSIENKEIEKHTVYADNVPVGVISIHNEGRGKYYLGNLCVIPEYQHKGIGKQAISLIIDEMKEKFSCSEIYLFVVPENLRAKHVYEEVGFVSTAK